MHPCICLNAKWVQLAYSKWGHPHILRRSLVCIHSLLELHHFQAWNDDVIHHVVVVTEPGFGPGRDGTPDSCFILPTSTDQCWYVWAVVSSSNGLIQFLSPPAYIITYPIFTCHTYCHICTETVDSCCNVHMHMIEQLSLIHYWDIS